MSALQIALAAAVAAATLSVAGCGTTAITPSQIQAACVTACSFVPAAGSVAAVRAAAGSGASIASIAALICNAFTANQAKLGAPAPGAPATGPGALINFNVLVNGQIIPVNGTIAG